MKKIEKLSFLFYFVILFFDLRDKVCCNIADMFMARGVLHDKAYQHLKVKIIEEMLTDSLLLADQK